MEFYLKRITVRSLSFDHHHSISLYLKWRWCILFLIFAKIALKVRFRLVPYCGQLKLYRFQLALDVISIVPKTWDDAGTELHKIRSTPEEIPGRRRRFRRAITDSENHWHSCGTTRVASALPKKGPPSLESCLKTGTTYTCVSGTRGRLSERESTVFAQN